MAISLAPPRLGVQLGRWAGCLIPRSWSDPEGVKELAYPRALPLIEHLASAASEATARTRAETFRLPSAGAARRIVEALGPA